MLSAFSPVQRANLLDFGRVAVAEARKSSSSKAATTEKSRQDCFLTFCQNMGIEDPTASHIPTSQSNFLLGCFTVSLMRGNTCLGITIQSATISGYLQAAANLYTSRSKELEDPFRAEGLDTNYPAILLKNLKKFETVPNRRNVITDEMFQYIKSKAKTSNEDSLYSALDDWYTWSRYSGPRRSEWCQTRKTKYDVVEGTDEAQAFIFDDISFADERGSPLDPCTDSFDLVESSFVKWRYQKNDDNGEIIQYFIDKINKDWDTCRALWNIARRAKRLGIKAHEPIAKYKADNGRIFFITDKDVKATLQEAARATLGITDENLLSKWTSHSLRVTAANELHRLGFSGPYIKHRLRWRSNKFEGYLRHTIHVARMHTEKMRLLPRNLELRKSNLDEVNERIPTITLYRPRGQEDDLLRELTSVASRAA